MRHVVDGAVVLTGTVSVRVEVTGGSVTVTVAVPQIVEVGMGSLETGAVGVGSLERLQAVGIYRARHELTA